jgi:hypothetical protein
VKVGDLIKIKECLTITGNKPIKKCGCFLCSQNSSRVGLVTSESIVPKTLDVLFWEVLFDAGQWTIYQSDIDEGDVEIINESR